MPQVTLTFNTPEETAELNTALRGGKYLSVLTDFDNYLRNRIKYEEGLSKEEIKALTTTRTTFHEMLIDRGIDIYSE